MQCHCIHGYVLIYKINGNTVFFISGVTDYTSANNYSIYSLLLFLKD